MPKEINEEFNNFDIQMLKLNILVHEYANARIRNNGEYKEFRKDILECMRHIINKERRKDAEK